MPELPEVETTLRGIRPHIEQQRITDIVVRHYSLRWPVAADIVQKLKGKTIVQLQRRGKYLLLSLNQGTLILHLGMSGRLSILDRGAAPQKHDHLDILFTNQLMLRFTDPRRFGAVLWTETDPHSHLLLKNLGCEPLEKLFTAKYLWQITRARKVPIKTLIMDSKIVVGVGNIYANEALFAAKIHPLTPANLITMPRYTLLVKAIKTVLQHAIQQGGTTLKDFYNSNGKPGYFTQQLQAYGREGLPCVNCGTLLTALRISQRSTVCCEKCQVLS